MLACLLLAACVGRADPPQSTEFPAPIDQRSQFQRWLDQYDIDYTVPAEGRAILVNVPAYELIAFEDGEPALTSRVIVGTPANPTPLIDTYVTTVRFRPTWRPTPDMVASGEYEDYRRPAGPNNPLGLAAIRLEPGLLVYLHDTNRRDLFAETDRALSHGCVRVQGWDTLIAWLLGVDVATVHRWAEGTRTFDQPAPPIPVTIGYFLRFPDANGALITYPDIYGYGPVAMESVAVAQPAPGAVGADAPPSCRTAG